MGQKVNPHGLRVGVIDKWNSQWYAGKQEFASFILEDHKIRKHIETKYKSCGISKVVIERPQGKVQVSIHAQFPGRIIGQKHVEKRAFFRRTMKQAMSKATHAGAKGVKVMVGGRLDGAEIARAEHYQEGSIPLQTIRADIDYGFAVAQTTFGVLGVKVWIYKGDVLGKAAQPAPKTAEELKEGE